MMTVTTRHRIHLERSLRLFIGARLYVTRFLGGEKQRISAMHPRDSSSRYTRSACSNISSPFISEFSSIDTFLNKTIRISIKKEKTFILCTWITPFAAVNKKLVNGFQRKLSEWQFAIKTSRVTVMKRMIHHHSLVTQQVTSKDYFHSYNSHAAIYSNTHKTF